MSKALALCALMTLFATQLIACNQAPIKDESATCRSSDWFEKGRQDGSTGLSPQLDANRSECGPIFNEDKKSLYMNGYHAGLTDYCTPENAFKIGQMGGSLDNLCPEVMKETFLQGYNKGLQSRKLKAQNEQLARRIELLSKQARSRNIASTEGASLSDQIEQLKKLYAKNQKRLNRMNN
ncbi:MAG: hypothetical protein CL676_12285 [Bdellovibrionaceae bacterium]|nr:hypothetical protein [Pseudobdellovibrionaceae bacterium]|tara:strand:- start:276 stop:815 length:540 start_codon:yes stop_codon:yes gene_type:complete